MYRLALPLLAALSPACIFGPHRARIIESTAVISAGASLAAAAAASDCGDAFVCLRTQVIELGGVIAAFGALGLALSCFDDDAPWNQAPAAKPAE